MVSLLLQMGGVFSTSGQKTTTVFSQIPAENEVAPGIKLTNAVLNKISQGDSGLTNQVRYLSLLRIF